MSSSGLPPLPPNPSQYVIDGVSVNVDLPITQYARFDLMFILNKIFNLLVTTISSMEAVTSAQAARLNFLTSWQQAYTDKLQQVPTFVGGGSYDTGDPIGGVDTEASNARSDLNQLNSAFTNQMNGQNTIVQDDAKSLQASVNQSNDAVNQMSNLATSIIQEFNTLLSQIFK